jgi:hypothetical protein
MLTQEAIVQAFQEKRSINRKHVSGGVHSITHCKLGVDRLEPRPVQEPA